MKVKSKRIAILLVIVVCAIAGTWLGLLYGRNQVALCIRFEIRPTAMPLIPIVNTGADIYCVVEKDSQPTQEYRVFIADTVQDAVEELPRRIKAPDKELRQWLENAAGIHLRPPPPEEP